MPYLVTRTLSRRSNMDEHTKNFVEAIIHAYERGYEKSIEDQEITEEMILQDELDSINFLFEEDGE